MRIRFTARAVSDLESARDYYSAIDPELGHRLLSDLDAAMERLETFPAGAPSVEGFDELRRARLRHFPYGIFYQRSPGGNDLLVVRVLHTRRDHPPAHEHAD